MWFKKAKLHVNLETQSWGSKGIHFVCFFVTRQKTVLDLKDKGLSKTISNSFTFIVILLCGLWRVTPPMHFWCFWLHKKLFYNLHHGSGAFSVFKSIFGLDWIFNVFSLKIQTQNEHHINVHKSCAKGNSVLEFHKQADYIIYGGSNLLT